MPIWDAGTIGGGFTWFVTKLAPRFCFIPGLSRCSGITVAGPFAQESAAIMQAVGAGVWSATLQARQTLGLEGEEAVKRCTSSSNSYMSPPRGNEPHSAAR